MPRRALWGSPRVGQEPEEQGGKQAHQLLLWFPQEGKGAAG